MADAIQDRELSHQEMSLPALTCQRQLEGNEELGEGGKIKQPRKKGKKKRRKKEDDACRREHGQREGERASLPTHWQRARGNSSTKEVIQWCEPQTTMTGNLPLRSQILEDGFGAKNSHWERLGDFPGTREHAPQQRPRAAACISQAPSPSAEVCIEGSNVPVNVIGWEHC